MTKVVASIDMNETDVREVIVRPFLNKLGYEFGQDANLRTESYLRYSYAFLGRKKPGRDPQLAGKPDYICEIIPYGRWITEVKRTSHELTLEDSYQAHTYATHPEIAAWFYLVTNGRVFQAFQVGHPDKPLLIWQQNEIESRFFEIKNLLGPQAIRQRHTQYKFEPGKPLSEGLGVKAQIAAGFATARETRCNKPIFQQEMQKIIGLSSPIIGGSISRKEDGLINATIIAPGAFAALEPLLKATGSDKMTFETADEYVSVDSEHPSIFQGIVTAAIPRGTFVPGLMGQNGYTMPVDLETSSFVQAVAHIQSNRCRGVYTANYTFKVKNLSGNPAAQQFAKVLGGAEVEVVGDFDITLR
jgi:hypothetical protein